MAASRGGGDELAVDLVNDLLFVFGEPIRQAVFGNVGTLVAFRIGYTDLHTLPRRRSICRQWGTLAAPEALTAWMPLLAPTILQSFGFLH